MTKVRTMAWGTLAAALVTAVVSAPQPVVGQQPSLTTPAPDQKTDPAPGFGPAAVYSTNGFNGMGGYYGTRVNQDRSRIAQIAQQYVKATKDDEKKDIRKKLSEALGQQFDHLAEQQQKELEDLEKQVAALRTLLKKRKDARETIIDRRLDQVVQEAEGLGWSVPAASPQPMSFTPRQ